MGVASNRVDVHQACAAAERALERRGRAAERAVPPGRSVSAAPRRRSVAPPRAQQRPRLFVRVQQRRSRRRGAEPVPRGAPARRCTRARRDRAIGRPGRRRGRSRRRGEPHGGESRGNRRGRSRPTANRSTSSPTTACPVPTQEIATVDEDGVSTVVVGQKIRWVLDLMRGHEFAGRPVTRATHTVAATAPSTS